MKKLCSFLFAFLVTILFVKLDVSAKGVREEDINDYIRRNIKNITEESANAIFEKHYEEITEESFSLMVSEIKSKEKTGFHNANLISVLMKKKPGSGEKNKPPKGIDNIKKEFKIKNHEYFENLELKDHYWNYIEYNREETCGYAAATILLGFYNEYAKPKYKNRGPVIKNPLRYKLKNKNYEINTMTTNYKGLPLPTIEFHDYLYKYVGVNKLGKKHWITQKGMSDVMNYHIDNNTVFTREGDLKSYHRKKGSIPDLLHKNIPVVATYVGHDYYYPESKKYYRPRSIKNAHCMLIYGYRETDAGFYYLVHMGWTGSEETKVMLKGAGTIHIRRVGFAYLNNADGDFLI